MKTRPLTFLAFLIHSALPALCASITTRYSKSEFHTYCAMEAQASSEIANRIVDSIIADVQNDPEHLFDWALYGIGRQNDRQKDAVLVEYKMLKYEPENEYGQAVFDIIIPGLITFHDVTLDVLSKDNRKECACIESVSLDTLSNVNLSNWSRHSFMDATYSGNFLKTAYGNLYIIPICPDKTVFYIDAHARFGWFFNLFMSKRVYKNTVEWRVKRYMENIVHAAENLAETMK